MAETGHVIFDIHINGIIADTNIDLVKEWNDTDILWYRDYMVMIQGRKQESKRHLLISLQASGEFMDRNGPLKGFEVLKLNNPDNSLASPNPFPPGRDSPSQTLQYMLRVFGDRNTIASALITIISFLNIVVYKWRQFWEHNSKEEEKQPSARAQRLCRRFSLAEILSATENFNYAFVIGKGGFGKVYKGLIDNGQETVAIKRLKFSSKQGAHEFWTEIDTLSEVRHLNLVSLIGYCDEQQEMILVYEYMTCGTLADHLYKLSKDSNNSSLSWTERLNICIGAGRGLDYLHTGCGIIHRDVKASNILLDEKFVAKVSDFGLAKPEKRNKLQSHVSTMVKGTHGYLDPYYYRTGKLTRQSDAYAFGVVLLEVLCGRPALDPSVEEDKCSLTVWARENIRKGELEHIISSNLKGEISPDSLKAFVRVSESCLDDEPKKRPTMAQVVLQLEFALEQQESLKFLVPNEIGVANALPSINETVLSVSTEKLIMVSTDEENVASPPIVQPNGNMVAKPSPPELGLPTSNETHDRSDARHPNGGESVHSYRDSVSEGVVPKESGHHKDGENGLKSSSRSSVSEGILPKESGQYKDGENGLKSTNSVVPGNVSQIEAEWTEQYVPGVYITLVPRQDGTRYLKRARFSRRRFVQHEAETWWLENRKKVYEKYNLVL